MNLTSNIKHMVHERIVNDVLNSILKQNVEATIPVIHQLGIGNGIDIITRELAPHFSIIDYVKRKQTDPMAELRNSEWYIGRSIKDYL